MLLALSCLLHKPWAQQAIPANANAFYQTAMQHINPKHIAWVRGTAASMANKQSDAAGLRVLAGSYGKNFNLNETDINALIALLMMQMAKDSEQDLKAQMDAMKKNNDDKKKIRDAMDQLDKSKNTLSKTAADSFRRLAATTQINYTKTNIASAKVTNAATANVSPAELKNLQDELKQKSDQLSDMSQSQGIRLQMLMDRRSKAMEELSNLMKKISETESGIIQNLK